MPGIGGAGAGRVGSPDDERRSAYVRRPRTDEAKILEGLIVGLRDSEAADADAIGNKARPQGVERPGRFGTRARGVWRMRLPHGRERATPIARMTHDARSESRAPRKELAAISATALPPLGSSSR